MLKIYVVSLGCAKNQVDTEKMLGALLSRQATLCATPQEADLLLVNTCAFIEAAREEAYATIIELAALKQPQQRLIVCGCLVSNFSPAFLKTRVPEVDAWLSVPEESGIAAVSARLLQRPAPTQPYGKRVRVTPPHYGFLRIADGCDHRCAFCSIPRIRGAYAAENRRELVREAKRMAAEGVVELNVIAQDTSAYQELPALLRDLCRIKDLFWIRLQYLYPATLSDELLDVMAGEEKICSYIDLPLQHINAEVLQSMHRPTKDFTLRLLEKIQTRLPEAALRTSLIAGFPTETPEAFQELLTLVQSGVFHHLGVFPYSAEPQTPAYALGDPIPAEEKERRAAALMEAQQAVSRAKNRAQIGETLAVLLDTKNEDGSATGRRTIDAPEVDDLVNVLGAEAVPEGSLIPVTITAADSYDLSGTAQLEGLL